MLEFLNTPGGAVHGFARIRHITVLAFLSIGAFLAGIGAWFAILFTGRCPRGIFN